jgi:putative flippase GtrA
MLRKITLYLELNKLFLKRFILVGILTFGLNNIFFTIFNSGLDIEYKRSISIAYILTVLSHFLMHRFFTYRNHDEKSLRQSVSKYSVMLCINYAITLLISIFTVEVLKISPYFGILFSTGATALTSFIMMNHFVFQKGWVLK